MEDVSPEQKTETDNRFNVGWKRAWNGDLQAMGLRTRLYEYQRKSVAQMLIQEAAPERFQDIKFVKMHEVGKNGYYYIDLYSGEVRRECDVGLYDLPKGGILCEEMGTGKTLITLSLILATSQQRAFPDSAVPRSPIITKIGLAKFPSLRLSPGDYPIRDEAKAEAEGTLSSLALHRHISCRSTHIDEALPLPERAREALKTDLPFYYQYPEQDLNCRRSATQSGANQSKSAGKKIYLSCASLVVVPRLLVKQWQGEIAKHFEEGSLVYITVGEKLPTKEEVLRSHVSFRFTYMVHPTVLTQLIAPSVQLVLISDARFRNAGRELQAQAMEGDYFDIFTDIRWKRVIIDEGHVANTANGGLMHLARKTCSEAFWAVSGTPTKHALSSFSYATCNMPDTGRWSDESLKDLNHLLGILTNLLQMKPFDVTGKSIATSPTTLVINPLRAKEGPVHGAVERVQKIIHSVMVRTREEDIATEVQLPAYEERRHELCLDYMGQLTYNVLQAFFAVNVVTSRRVGPDYLLSPENRSSLLLAFQNLQRACCWYPAGHPDDFNPQFTLDVLEAQLQPKNLESFSDQDQCMMRQAQRWLSAAVKDKAWQSLMPKVSVPIHATQLPVDVLQATSTFPLFENGTALTSAEVTLALRSAASTITDREKITGSLVGAAISARKHETTIFVNRRVTKQARKNQTGTSGKVLHPAAKPPAATKSLRRSERAAAIDLRNIQDIDDEDSEIGQSPHHVPQKRKRGQQAPEHPTRAIAEEENLPLSREVQELQFAFNTLSSKLDWMIAEIVNNEDDRFVVFGKDATVLGQLTESLVLYSVWIWLGCPVVYRHLPSCYVGFGLSDVKAREAAIDIFQHKMRRVCLIEIELAGRGLNLVVANRVIFTEPTWKEDLERQAIARVYRIGQQRSTRCDILFIKGSQEQDILERRHGSKAGEAQDDDVIRNSIANPRFIEDTAPPRHPFIVPLVNTSNPGDMAYRPRSNALAEDPERQDNALAPVPPGLKQEHQETCPSSQPANRARFQSPVHPTDMGPSTASLQVTALHRGETKPNVSAATSITRPMSNKARKRVRLATDSDKE
ncbi:hypothetical protein QFC19_002630 [Naganishia cerealis]|uniref:Uncharacterized protein n=1 Tax=Naganishia cerealis TaxID=610337 RepID=A0ACC2W8B7_9TREE|nr:hypothetical protein QFC19_002630 [Naganishia cerealis]